MIEVEFDYNQQLTVIHTELDVVFQVVINKYLQKSLLDSNSIYFIANGKTNKSSKNCRKSNE